MGAQFRGPAEGKGAQAEQTGSESFAKGLSNHWVRGATCHVNLRAVASAFQLGVLTFSHRRAPSAQSRASQDSPRAECSPTSMSRPASPAVSAR